MLYVFQVDTGKMMTFEMKLAMENVSNLKKAIAARTLVPENKQVLLVSGGESLNSNQRVCSYSSAGTDTSPIYLFAKVNIEANQLPAECEEFDEEIDFTEMIESCISMAPNVDTLIARTELAININLQATKQKEMCEKLVHEQHLQQQGWAAVTANLEDLIRAFETKAETLLNAFNAFIERKAPREQLLNIFKDDLKTLDSIPILPTLIDTSRYFSPSSSSSNTNSNEFDSSQTAASSSLKSGSALGQQSPSSSSSKQDNTTTSVKQASKSSSSSTSSQNLLHNQQALSSSKAQNVNSSATTTTLLQWIDFHDSQSSLEKLAESSQIGLERFTRENAKRIEKDIQEVLKSSANESMKEIRGLEGRLCGLESLMVNAQKVVDEQNRIVLSFQSNRDRVVKSKDLSVLPVLSTSHQRQLEMMLSNYNRMRDLRTKCFRAKQELSVNLLNRLRWVMFVEQKISDLDGKLMIYKENLTRLNKSFEILEQVHRTPELYLAAVTEAMRRRRFSRSYLHWASMIAKKSQELYENELKTRMEFDKKMGNHFLTNLFPGITHSYPPPFATILPDPFDTKLPRITAADINYLRNNISKDLADKLTIPKDISMPHIVSISPRIAANAQLDIQSRVDSNILQEDVEDLDDRHSLNPTPPSSPQSSKPYFDS